jgi:hypothetical protein
MRAKLFDRLHPANYDSVMSKPVIIEELPRDPEFERAFAKAERNREWFSQHAKELGVFQKYRGRYVAAAGGELFVADTAEKIGRLVRDKYPDEVPHVRYILREKCDRIYAYQRSGLNAKMESSGRV